MPMTKEFKTVEQQISGLEQRNLKFKNKRKAVEILYKYNYFDIINGFESILLKQGTSQKVYENVYFEDFWDLYLFDMRLKKQTLFKIFDIESRMRTAIAYHFSRIYCNTSSTIMNYLNPVYYHQPNPSDTYLTKRFQKFDLFREKQYDKYNRKVIKKSFLDELKAEKDYVAKYEHPPFWVVIKSQSLGTLYFLYIFLRDEVKEPVLKEFQLSLAESRVFEQAIYVIKEARNQCAHLELITRFRKKRDRKLNNFKDITDYAGLSKSVLNYMDVLKILKIFGEIRDIKKEIAIFYLKMCMKGRKPIADKILSKMGRKNIGDWLKL